MKVPFTTPKTQNHSRNNITNTPHRSTNTYEPKSVLDLRRSPSPAAAGKPAEFSDFSDVTSHSDYNSLPWVDHVLDNYEDWDSLIRELGAHDDSTPALKSISHFPHCETQFSEFPTHSFDSTRPRLLDPSDFTLSDIYSNQNFNQAFDLCDELHQVNHWNVKFNFVDELVRLADCFDSNDSQLGCVILARLNRQLESPVGNSLRRAAFYFKEALESLLTESIRPTRTSSSSEIIQTIKAYKMFSNISPIVMFSNFTANQAILEAIHGSRAVHVIDFDIGLGGHYASLMKEIAEKSSSPVLRITAVIPEDYAIESRLIRDNLSHFARDLNIRFEIDFLLIRKFEFLSFQAIKFVEGEKIAVLLSPAIFRQIGAGFVPDLRRISPHIVVYVDGEGLTDDGTSSFRRTVIDGHELYSTVLESLEAASIVGGDDWIRTIEMYVLRPKIFAAVEAAAGRGSPPWREAFAAAGIRPVALSQFADFQAECLLRRLQVRGFHVAKRRAEMVLCWLERPLIATSAWRC